MFTRDDVRVAWHPEPAQRGVEGRVDAGGDAPLGKRQVDELQAARGRAGVQECGRVFML